MDKSTLEKAKGIECEIERLEEEIRTLDWGSFRGILRTTKTLIRERCNYEEYIKITENDTTLMIELRKKRIEELQKELEQL